MVLVLVVGIHKACRRPLLSIKVAAAAPRLESAEKSQPTVKEVQVEQRFLLQFFGSSLKVIMELV